MEVTRTDLLRNRNIWHTMSVLPPQEYREPMKPNKAQKKTGVIRARIDTIQDEIRLRREFEL